MRSNRARYRLGFPLLFAFALLACGGREPVPPEEQVSQAFADLRSAVEAVVEDGPRKTEALHLVDEFEADVDELRTSLVARRAEFRRLNADYDTTPAEFEAFAAAIKDRIRDERGRVFATVKRLNSTITPEERSALDRVQTKAMRRVARSLQSI